MARDLHRVASFCLAASIGCAATDAAQAQAGTTKTVGVENGGLEEVVVTARKTAEPLQKVPISVTAFTAADLAKRPVQSLLDIQRDTPSLDIRQGVSTAFGGPIDLRGQYVSYNNLAGQPSVGVYYDDVYRATSGVTSGGFFDVSEIEVLKGAQGTLYGRNSTGGAIKISTTLPNYDGFSGKAKFGYGDYGQNEEGVAINIPIIDQKLAARVSGDHVAHDGYGKILDANGNKTSTDINNADSKNVRAALRFDPADDLQFVFRSDYSYSQSQGLAQDIIFVGPLNSVDYAGAGASPLKTATGFLNAAVEGGQGFNAAAGRNILKRYLFPQGSYNAYSVVPNPHTDLREGGVSLTGSYNLNDTTILKSITAYRGSDETAYGDTVGTPAPFNVVSGYFFDVRLRQITQELQLTGKALDDKLKYALGYFYFDTDGLEDPTTRSFDGVNPQPLLLRHAEVTDTSHAVYGQGTLALTDTVNATGGLRWTTETNQVTTTSYSAGNTGRIQCNTAAVPQTVTASSQCYKQYPNSGFRNVSYTFGLDWSVLPDTLLYAKTSRGFKAGGVNTSGNYDSYGPEIVTDYEGGMKSDWFEHKLRVDGAIFYSEFKGLQRLATFPVNGVLSTEVFNAASAEVTGVELEAVARPFPGVELRAGGSYIYPKYDTFNVIGPSGETRSLAGTRFFTLPRWKGSFTAAYTNGLEIGSLRSSITWTPQSSVYYGATIPFAQTAPFGVTTQNGYSLFDARVALTIDEYDLEVAGFIKNITNKRYFQTESDISNQYGVVTGELGPPRTFGFELTKYF